MQSENFRTLKLTIQSNGTLGEIEAEQERLRESYSQTRQQRRADTKSRSRSGIRKNRKNNLNDTSGTFMARETSDFRKIYDNQTQDRDEIECTIDANKENDMSQNGSESKLHNRYKRNQRTDQSINNYQDKYNKLEENFKRFTASLLDKRSSSNNMRMSANLAQSTNQSFVPIKCDASPVRRADLNKSNNVSPSNFFTSGNPRNFTSNPIIQSISSNQPKFLMPQQLTHKKDAPSVAFAFDSTIPDQIKGSSRLQMLINLVTRLNQFIDTCYDKLVSLCISKQQEIQIKEVQTQMRQLVSRCTQNIEVLEINNSNEHENFGKLEDECQKVQEVYKSCFTNLEICFSELLGKIYQVESETFKNYKFKDAIASFDLILQESFRLNLFQLMPSMMQMLSSQRIKSAAIIIRGHIVRQKTLQLKRRFIIWRSTIGMRQFLSMAFRQANLSKTVSRMIKKSQQTRIVRYLHIWKQILFNRKQLTANSTQNGNLVEILMLDKKIFSQCIESDYQMTANICAVTKKQLGDQFDLILIAREDQGESVLLSGFQADDGSLQQVTYNAVRESLTAIAIERELKKGVRQNIQLMQFYSLFGNKSFNEKIDTPLLQKDFMNSKSFGDLNMLVIPLVTSTNQLKGLLRLFSQAKIQEKDFDIYERLGHSIGQFIDRVYCIRSQLFSLQEELEQKSNKLSITLLEKAVHTCIFEILQGVQGGTKVDFIQLLQQRANILLNDMINGCFLRQIYHHTIDKFDSHVLQKVISTPLIDENENPNFQVHQLAIVRQKDHRTEQKDLLEDFLDYRAEKVVHQISVNQLDGFTFVFHRDLPKNQLMRKGLTQDLKFALNLFAKCLKPVLQQGLTIHEDLAIQLKNQARKLVRQVSINQSREDLRSLLSKLPGLNEFDFCKKFSDSIYQVMRSSDILTSVSIEQFATMVNLGLLSGAPLTVSNLVAYLDQEQNELLEMPEDLKIQLQNPNALTRYEALQQEYTSMKQEIQVTGQQKLSVKLPVTSERALIAVVRIELSIREEEVEKGNIIQDVKALVAQIQVETSKVLLQVVFAQAHQNYQFKDCFDQIQSQVNSLTTDLDFMQALQKHLILPFTQAPSTKMLGTSLTVLTGKVLPQLRVDAISLIVEGQCVIEDIRLLDWRLLTPDSSKQTKIAPLHFNMEEKTINLHLEGDREERGLLLRLSMSKELINQMKETTNDFILQQCEVYQMIITPFIKAAMSSLSIYSLLPAKQEQLPRVITKIVMQRKYGLIQNFFMRLKELQVNRVPIFTRLKSYKCIVKKHYESFGIESKIGYNEDEKREYLTRMHVLQTFGKAFSLFNRIGIQLKQRSFNQFKNQILLQLSQEDQALQFTHNFQPTKLQRKSVGLIHKIAKKLLLRAYFGKYAVLSKVFRFLKNPNTRQMAAAFCIFHNHQNIKIRKAFQRFRAHSSNVYFKGFSGSEVQDREYMHQLLKILYNTNLSSLNAAHSLEQAVQSVLEQSMNYLQQVLYPQQLDVILISIQSTDQRKAKAYVFNNRMPNQRQSVQRIGSTEAFDGVMTDNLDMLTDNLNGLKDFNMIFQRDIILQMLQKSQTTFNFGNVSQSLYDLYLNHLGRQSSSASKVRQDLHRLGHRLDGPISSSSQVTIDPEIAQRMMLIKKSKSALVIPFLVPIRPGYSAAAQSSEDQIYYEDDVAEFKLAGSFELYRFHYQLFDDETEKRVVSFASVIANDILPVYFQLRQTQSQIQSLQKQISANSKPLCSLTRLLRQVYFNAPTQLNAAQILPIIIEQKSHTAYFYHFKDSHIYNFVYSNTFIGEIVDFGCILELATTEGGEDSQGSTQRSQQVTDRDFMEVDQPESVYNQIPSHRKRNINCGKIRSVSNENFKHILYYPVIGGPLNKTKAVVEVCFDSLKQVPKNVLTPQIQTFLESFSSKLNQLESKLRIFCKFTESAITKREGMRLSKYFLQWKSNVIFDQKQEEFATNQQYAVNQNEQCFNEYLKSLESYDTELKKLVEIKEETDRELIDIKIDRNAKYKFLAAALILIQGMNRRQKKMKVRQMFARWKYNQNISKIAESAFNKLLELNHRHSQRRFSSACFLLEKSVGKIMKRDAIKAISKFAVMTQLRYYRQKKYNSSFHASEISQSFVKPSFSDNFSNVLAPGVISRLNNNQSAILSNGEPSQFNSNVFSSAVPNNDKTNMNNMSSISIAPTPNKSGRTYDSQMEQFGLKMGFGAVPNNVQSKRSSKKRSTSRSTSQKRFVNK